jgi:tRNA dimethylallyltransferase
MNSAKKIIVIVGPTAVGKTAIAIQLALHFKTEIISADSRQFYKEMRIGTAKPTPSELNLVTHHFINSLSIHDKYNAGQYAKDAENCIENILLTNNYVIVTGGSGLYINALFKGLDSFPTISPATKLQIANEYNEHGLIKMFLKLKRLDPSYATIVDSKNPSRILRALEVCVESGSTYSSFIKSNTKNLKHQLITIGLETEREILYHKINLRVLAMMTEGLEEEAKALQQWKHLNALHTVGYAELFDYFEGNIELYKAIELIQQHTRNYAKRQLTWFKKDQSIHWLTADGLAFSKAIALIQKQG